MSDVSERLRAAGPACLAEEPVAFAYLFGSREDADLFGAEGALPAAKYRMVVAVGCAPPRASPTASGHWAKAAGFPTTSPRSWTRPATWAPPDGTIRGAVLEGDTVQVVAGLTPPLAARVASDAASAPYGAVTQPMEGAAAYAYTPIDVPVEVRALDVEGERLATATVR